jgi:hypothetical protein
MRILTYLVGVDAREVFSRTNRMQLRLCRGAYFFYHFAWDLSHAPRRCNRVTTVDGRSFGVI